MNPDEYLEDLRRKRKRSMLQARIAMHLIIAAFAAGVAFTIINHLW